MASANNFSVFLDTLSRSSASGNALPFGSQTIGPDAPSPTDTQTLAPVLTTLLKYPSPIDIAQLAAEAQVSITPLVLSLLRLQESGVVQQDESKNNVVLTPLGRQMLNVGKMIR
jgi:hypothetical protein